MTDRSTVTRLESYALSQCTPQVPARASDRSGPDEQGLFYAGLHYIAADLAELAKAAPPDKTSALLALVRLIRVLAKR
ncbi:MAG: hypothetical protein EA406_09015 [Rhodospirillales bacterium]|nr:MAG: hypothetical protein EA406_09015 [Rhodospirillales bacterium]